MAIGALGIGAIGLGANILDRLVGSAIGQQSARNTMSYQSQLDRANQAWLLQNSARLQKQGLQAAGYSPAMMNGVTSPSGSMGTPTPSAPYVQGNDTISALANAQQSSVQTQLLASQRDKNEAEAEEARERAGLNRSNSRFTDAQTAIKQFDLQYMKPLEQQLAEANIGLTVQQRDTCRAQMGYFQASVAEAFEKIQLYKTEERLNDKQLNVLDQSIRLMGAQVQQALASAFAERQRGFESQSNIRLNREYAKSEMANQKYLNSRSRVAYYEGDMQKALSEIQSIQAEALKNLGSGYVTGKIVLDDVSSGAKNALEITGEVRGMKSKRSKVGFR